MYDVTTFGEVMLRFSVPEGTRLQAATQFDVVPGGSEANCAMLLARLGHPVAWNSALPASALGRMLADHIRTAGVDLDGVIWYDSGRVGTYYIEFTAPPRAIQVIYDRADSCVTQVTPDQLHWETLLDTRLVHLTGITPALSNNCRETTEAILARAKAASVPISFDVNYRAKLWSEADAADWLKRNVRDVDLLLCGQGDAKRLFGFDGTPESIVDGLVELTGAKAAAVTLGEAGVIGWDGSTYYQEAALPVRVIDRMGAGDALAMGIIHGWLQNEFAYGLRCGVTLAALALSQHGDDVITTPDELADLLAATHNVGSVQR